MGLSLTAKLRRVYHRVRDIPKVGPYAVILKDRARTAIETVAVHRLFHEAVGAPGDDRALLSRQAGALAHVQKRIAELEEELELHGGLLDLHSGLLEPRAQAFAAVPDASPSVCAPWPDEPSFSVVVNTYNRATLLANTLESFEHQTYKNFEVIVVNGPSTDGTAELLEEYRGKVKIGTCSETNLSMSRNIGIAMASGDVVAFIDDDAVPKVNWLEELARAYSDTTLGGVGGPIRDHTGHAYQCKVVVCDRLGDGAGYQTLEEADYDTGADAHRYLVSTGANSSFRRDRLLEIGGFDEEFVWFLDETDVVVRLLDAGYPTGYTERAEVLHKYAASHLRTQEKIPTTIYYPVRSKAYFVATHGTKQTSLRGVLARLAEYATSLKRDYRWLLEAGKIDEAHYHRLIDDVDRGKIDGLRDALSGDAPQFLSSETRKAHASKFLQYKPLLPISERQRLCFLTQEFPPGAGGIGVWTHALATTLAGRGHDVWVVTRSEGHHTVDFEDGVWVHRVPITEHPHRSFPQVPDVPAAVRDLSFSFYDEVREIHDTHGLDVVSAPIWDVEGLACQADPGLNVVLSLHTSYQMALASKPEWSANADYMANHVNKVIAAEKHLLQSSRHVFANSEAIVRDMEAAYGITLAAERVSVVPHGVTDYRATTSRKLARGAALEVLFVGRLERRKGIDVLLEVVPELCSEFENLEFRFVGDDKLPDPTLGRTFKDLFLERHRGQEFLGRVHFDGWLNDADLHHAYLNCDVFVAPSRYESFGLIFAEAMVAGRPSVGCEAGGIPEVITHGEDGLLCAPGDPAALREALRKVLSDAALRETMGKAARASFEANFTLDAMADAALCSYATLRSADRQEVRSEAVSASMRA